MDTMLSTIIPMRNRRVDRRRFHKTKEPVHVAIRLNSQRKNFNGLLIQNHAGTVMAGTLGRVRPRP